MEIPLKVRKQADEFYEALDNPAYVISVASGRYLLKKGTWLTARHYHHIDGNRKNDNLWNLAPLSYEEHIIELHTKNNRTLKKRIFKNMCEKFPKEKSHYKRYLL